MTFKERTNSLIYAFPVQLFLVHLKKHQLLIFFWVLLTMLVCGTIATKFGIQYLFLDPEYLGQVGFLSFMFLGLGFGALFITWNITTYILNSFRFSFLGSLSKPFSKYCLNNFLVPLIFAIIYLAKLTQFQLFFERVDLMTFFIRLSGLLFGFATFCSFAFAYFFKTNTNVSKLLGFEQLDPDLKYKKVKASNPFTEKLNHDDDDDWFVKNYLSSWVTVRLVRETGHYDQKTLKMVFAQNHINALIIELIFFLTLIGLSFLDDNIIFRIPAGASMLLLFSIIIMFLGAFAYWLRGWRYFVMILFIVLTNFIIQHPFFEYKHLAYGLNYASPPATYNDFTLEALCTDKIINQDITDGIKILENWKKASATKVNPKPKMILINCSGGGVRSALWNVLVMQKVDSIANGSLMKNTTLITGASGGMLGAAYYRELYHRALNEKNENIKSPLHLERISKDLLNAVSFTLLVNDTYNPFHSIDKWGHNYPVDRGLAFEKQFHDNTKGILDKNIFDYKTPESNGIIPMMVLSPIITNDAKTLIISPQNTSYLSKPILHFSQRFTNEIEGVEFRRLFKEHDADSLRFSTALRMSATFPYIMPSINLPSKPRLEVMDAGMRDNFGTWLSIKYLFTFRKWIKENTSGVIILQIRDTPKLYPKDKDQTQSLIRRVFNPIGNFFTNWHEIQDLQIDNLIGTSLAWFDHELDFIRFQYYPSQNEKRASLSWHLTSKEKKEIIKSIDNATNQSSLKQLERLLNQNLVVVN